MLTETSAAVKLFGIAVTSVTRFEASKEAELAFYKKNLFKNIKGPRG